MKLTNRLNLPAPLFRAIEWQQSQHSVGEADLSCTQLIDSPLITWLWRKFGDQVQEDASERLWPLYGTLAHAVLEQFAGEGEHVETEAIAEIDGLRISGHIDLIVLPDGTLQDYKFTSAFTVATAKREGKPEWERQLNVYRYLVEKAVAGSGLDQLPQIQRLQIVAMLRDWGPRFERDGLKPVEVIEVPLWSQEQATSYLQERVALHKAAFGKGTPPICTPLERWTTPTTYAVMKQGRKSALRVCESREEAQQWMVSNGQGDSIEERPGKDKRCLSYCPFGKQELCPYRGQLPVLTEKMG